MAFGMCNEQREFVLRKRTVCLNHALRHGTLAHQFERTRDRWLLCNVVVVFLLLFVTFPVLALFIAGSLSTIAWALLCLFATALAMTYIWLQVEHSNSWRMRHRASNAWFGTLASLLLDESGKKTPDNDFIRYIFEQCNTEIAQHDASGTLADNNEETVQ